jgi:hypothetical protein
MSTHLLERSVGRVRPMRNAEGMMLLRFSQRAYWKLTLRYGLRVYRAIADWSREAEAVLEELSEEESEA